MKAIMPRERRGGCAQLRNLPPGVREQRDWPRHSGGAFPMQRRRRARPSPSLSTAGRRGRGQRQREQRLRVG